MYMDSWCLQSRADRGYANPSFYKLHHMEQPFSICVITDTTKSNCCRVGLELVSSDERLKMKDIAMKTF